MPYKIVPHQVVVITDVRDAHLRYVQRHLSSPLTIIDPQSILKKDEFSYEPADDLTLTLAGVRLDAVKSVWYRKPQDFDISELPVQEGFRNYVQGALQAHMNILLHAFPRALWMSNDIALRRAGCKGLQLSVAKKLGMRTPDTLFTSDRSRALNFIAEHEHCIVKPGASPPVILGQTYSFFTTRINKHSPPDLSNLYLAPAIFQQAIEPDSDIRVTVVGDKVFPASIRTTVLPKNAHILDWRIGHEDGGMEITECRDFPAELANKCVAHVRKLGLNYGALDFVKDARGEYWFLENNPNGQWGFVEEATNQPIGKAVAELLATHRQR